MRLILSVLIRNFNISPAEGTTAYSMEPVEFMTVSPRGGKCDLVFERRSV